MHSVRRFQLLALVTFLAEQTSAACQSYGVDFVDGGGPYCINTASTDYFSFGTSFTGCSASDTQGGTVTPLLVDPSTNQYYCSDIATNPDGTDMISTCNVAGNQVLKSSMVSGTWMVIIEGLTFAYMRSFSIIAAPQVTATSTPTASFTVTTTPGVNVTTTSTFVASTTLPPSTTTVPASTKTTTKTITPAPVTSTSTNVLTISLVVPAFTTTVVTVTSTTACRTAVLRADRVNTLKVTKSLATAKATAKVRRGRFEVGGAWAPNFRREAEPRGILQIRDADLCTTTVLATTNLPSVTTTVTAPTSTNVITVVVTRTSTITPAPVTAYSGTATVTVTTTKPTVTYTLVLQSILNTVITKTATATLISTKLVPPTGAACQA